MLPSSVHTVLQQSTTNNQGHCGSFTSSLECCGTRCTSIKCTAPERTWLTSTAPSERSPLESSFLAPYFSRTMRE
ncbi:hypothetical protein VTO73DRAFT_12928 [Trametes versicolor]